MDIKKVVLAGGGVLGSQIAFQCAFKGFDTTIWLRTDASIGRAQPKLNRVCEMYKEDLEGLRGLCGSEFPMFPAGLVDDLKTLTPDKIDELKEKADKTLASLHLTTDMAEAMTDADIVIESVAELPADKVAFYEKMAPLLPEKTIIATNSSTLLPSQFAEYTGRPEKFLAMHFANEIHRNNIAESLYTDAVDELLIKLLD